jgi:aminocarboxymuconate-semialdehyde decarboxylase
MEIATMTPNADPSRKRSLDIHAHMNDPEIMAWAKGHGVVHLDPPAECITEDMRRETVARNTKNATLMRDIGLRLENMDRTGVDVQALSLSSVMSPTCWAPPEEALKMQRRINDQIAKMMADYPSRFCGLGEIPLHSPSLAIEEMKHCIDDLGFIGVQVSSSAGEMELGDKRLWPVWEKAEELGALVYLHPSGSTDMRQAPWQIWNSIGQPFEEAMAMASLMYEGVLDAFPRLKVCVAHGGGYLPYYIGRLDRNYHEKPYTKINMTRSPSEYLNFFYYDSCVYNVDILEHLVEKVGADRVILGSDFPVGEEEPVEFVNKSIRLTDAEKEKIIWKNAATLFRVPAAGRAAPV